MVRIMAGRRRDVTLQKVVSGLDSWNIIFSAIICTGPDILTTSEDYSGVRKEGTRLAMPKTILRAGLLVIEARFRGY